MGSVIVLLLFSALLLSGEFYTWFNHYGWEENSIPNKKAKIQNITSEKVQHLKNMAKLKTKITFSDGFYFITYKTDRQRDFFIYTIFISDKHKKEIVELAKKKHMLAVDKFIAKK